MSNNLDLKNIISLSDIVCHLRNLNLMTEQTYQQLEILIADDHISSYSNLLYELRQEVLNYHLESKFPSLFVNVPILQASEYTNEKCSKLLHLLDQIKESRVITEIIYKRLQTDIVAFLTNEQRRLLESEELYVLSSPTDRNMY